MLPKAAHSNLREDLLAPYANAGMPNIFVYYCRAKFGQYTSGHFGSQLTIPREINDVRDVNPEIFGA